MTSTLKELTQVSRLPPPQCLRLAQQLATWTMGSGISESSITPYKILAFGVAEFLTFKMPHWSEAERFALLREMQGLLAPLAYDLDEIWKEGAQDAAVPAEQLGFAEDYAVTWRDLDKFYVPAEGEYVNPLPMNPMWMTSLHLGAVYFDMKFRLERQDAKPTADPSETAG